jgi:hypothetical protein
MQSLRSHFYSRDRIKGFVVRRFNEYVVIAVLLLVACLTHFGVAYAGTTDPTPSQLVGAASPAHPTGASAVVRQFYTLYMHKQDLAPERGLLDDRLYWLLKQESSDHPGYKFHGIGECYGDSDPFGLGQNAQFYKSFTLGTPIAQGNAVVVPVLLSPTSGQHLTAIVKDEGGTYKIYDINDHGGLRQELEGYARNPNCHWPQSGRG